MSRIAPAETSVVVASPAVQLVILGHGQAMVTAGGDLLHQQVHTEKVLHDGWDEGNHFAVALGELAVVSGSPGVQPAPAHHWGIGHHCKREEENECSMNNKKCLLLASCVLVTLAGNQHNQPRVSTLVK